MPEPRQNDDHVLLRGKQVIVDAEMERLLISLFASHDELVDALKGLQDFHHGQQAGLNLDSLLAKAESAMKNALKVRTAD